MGRVRQAERCTARRTNGDPCRAWAVTGAKVCISHGGGAPQVRAAAARRVAERKAARALSGITDFAEVSDPVARLRLLSGRAERLVEVLGERVEELRSVGYRSRAGEQLRAELAVYERMMATTGRLLVDLAKLNLDERQARIDEALGRLVIAALMRAFRDVGLPPDVQQALQPAVARHLRLVAAVERDRPALESR